jgi:heme/copper-type cytochrome/quinol oxidase subunit 2
MIHRTAAACCLTALLTACAGSDAPADPAADASQAPPTSAVTSAPSAPSSPSATPSPEPTVEGTVIELTYAGGEITGDTGRVEVALGDTVVLRVTSDVAEEVHVHGVDEYIDLPAGETTEATFVADVPGVFELELHGSGTLLTRMQVQ